MKRIFYIYQNGHLKRQDNSLVLKQNGRSIYIPIEQVDTIICLSDISVNKRTLSLLNRYKITILFYNFYGDYIGSFIPKIESSGNYLLEQVNAYNDSYKRLEIAREMNNCAFHNMLALIKYYNKNCQTFNTKINDIANCIDHLNNCQTIDELLILEAKCKQIYYSCFDEILRSTDYKFVSRSKRPPKNEINAMMSYGYSLLYGVVSSAIYKSKLSPKISFIHSISKHSDSLKYDIADIFKPVLVDRLIFRLVRKQLIKPEHFDYRDDRIYLNYEGSKLFCDYFNKNLESTIKYRKRYYSYKSIINLEINSLSKCIIGTKKYIGYKMKW